MLAEPINPFSSMNPENGLNQPKDVEFADTVNHKYPIDSPQHVRAAWSYIHHADNAAKYSTDEVSAIKERIMQAAEKYGVAVSEEDEHEKERQRAATR